MLRQSGVEPGVLAKLLAAKPLLFVDLGELPDSIDDQVVADLKERAFAVQMNFRRGWQSVFPVSGLARDGSEASRHGMIVGEGPRSSATLKMPVSMGRINIDLFRPAEFSADETAQ